MAAKARRIRKPYAVFYFVFLSASNEKGASTNSAQRQRITGNACS